MDIATGLSVKTMTDIIHNASYAHWLPSEGVHRHYSFPLSMVQLEGVHWRYWTIICKRLINRPLKTKSEMDWTMMMTGSSLERHRPLSRNVSLPPLEYRPRRALSFSADFDETVGNTLLGLSTRNFFSEHFIAFSVLTGFSPTALSVNRRIIAFLDDD